MRIPYSDINQGGPENYLRAAEGGTGPIALTLELKNLARVKAVVIEWQAAAKSFEVQVASDAGPWSVFASALRNLILLSGQEMYDVDLQ